jgi:DNA modification methylase
MRKIETLIRSGDCLKILKEYPDNFFDLIVTSPPYADSREKNLWRHRAEKLCELVLAAQRVISAYFSLLQVISLQKSKDIWLTE